MPETSIYVIQLWWSPTDLAVYGNTEKGSVVIDWDKGVNQWNMFRVNLPVCFEADRLANLNKHGGPMLV